MLPYPDAFNAIRIARALLDSTHKQTLLHKYLYCISRVAFVRTIRAFEPVAFAQPLERLISNNMTAWHHHRRILIRGLFFGYRAYEY